MRNTIFVTGFTSTGSVSTGDRDILSGTIEVRLLPKQLPAIFPPQGEQSRHSPQLPGHMSCSHSRTLRRKLLVDGRMTFVTCSSYMRIQALTCKFPAARHRRLSRPTDLGLVVPRAGRAKFTHLTSFLEDAWKTYVHGGISLSTWAKVSNVCAVGAAVGLQAVCQPGSKRGSVLL